MPVRSAALTVVAIEALKPDTKPLEVPDGHTAGLRLVVHPTGRKTWIVRYRATGDRTSKKLTLGPYPAITLKDARGRAAKAIASVAEGGDPASDKTAARGAAKSAAGDTVEVFVARFIADLKKKGRRTWPETERLLRNDAVRAWGRRPISSITKKDVRALLAEIVDRGSPVAANRAFAAIRRMFAYGVEEDHLEVTPCVHMKAPSPEVSRDRVLDDDELATVWRACDAIGGPFSPVVRLLILTGQRREEVGSMAWREVDVERRIWTIPAERSKNGAKHEVPLSRQALAILAELPRLAGSDLVHTVTGASVLSGYSRAKLRIDVAAAEERGAPLPEWRFHDLRRSFASGAARIGIALPVVERALNHLSGSFRGIVGTYQRHAFLAERQAAMDAWGRHVEAIVSGTDGKVIEFAAVRS